MLGLESGCVGVTVGVGLLSDLCLRSSGGVEEVLAGSCPLSGQRFGHSTSPRLCSPALALHQEGRMGERAGDGAGAGDRALGEEEVRVWAGLVVRAWLARVVSLGVAVRVCLGGGARLRARLEV